MIFCNKLIKPVLRAFDPGVFLPLLKLAPLYIRVENDSSDVGRCIVEVGVVLIKFRLSELDIDTKVVFVSSLVVRYASNYVYYVGKARIKGSISGAYFERRIIIAVARFKRLLY